ncbi:hypothetical protein PGRAN_04661 [Listeria grandensis FSL F6-0971]|uniref:Uncharacterized protein n=1 Tax=Listeria grandensis FSL F6-0971 TaxID=1265819 RepID=W7BHD1_9LIST|nr:hypothetical protein PGRAN_04661 [Listeria grandensis FSL F6-0971]
MKLGMTIKGFMGDTTFSTGEVWNNFFADMMQIRCQKMQFLLHDYLICLRNISAKRATMISRHL